MFPEFHLGVEPARELFEKGLHFASFAEHQRIVEIVKSAIVAKHGDAVVSRYYNDMPIRLNDLKTMAADPLVHIGSHSHHHLVYHEGQDPKVVAANITQSIRLLRNEWRVSSQPTFCYPNGDWARPWVEYLRKLGVPASFPNITGFVDPTIDPDLMPRFWITNARRTRAVAAMSLIGNKALYAFGRKPPPRLN
jgi:peptidoglycan/xylan/chitin deacetylase (PgdA/CDA1 family)